MTDTAKLRSALEPFARRANAYDGIPDRKYFGDTDCALRHPDNTKVEFTLAECRAARQALSELNREGEGDVLAPREPPIEHLEAAIDAVNPIGCCQMDLSDARAFYRAMLAALTTTNQGEGS